MKHIVRWLIILIVAAAAGACGSYHPVRYYRISSIPPATSPPAQIPLTVEVGTFSAPAFYQDQMVFRNGDYRMGFYEFSRWIAPPPDLVRQAIMDILRRSNRFKRINIDDNIIPADIVINGWIKSFDQVREGEEVSADFSMILEAIRSDTARVIWSYSPAVRVKQVKEGEFAAAMSEAVRRGLTQALDDLGGQPVLKEMVKENQAPTSEQSGSETGSGKKGEGK